MVVDTIPAIGQEQLLYWMPSVEAACRFVIECQMQVQGELHRLRRGRALVTWPGCNRPIEVVAQANSFEVDAEQTERLIHVATGSWPREVLVAQLEMAEAEQPMGMNRLHDGLQCALNTSAVQLLGDKASSLLTKKRRDYWHPASLDEFHQTCRDRGGSDRGFEFRYCAQYRGGQAWFQTHYRVIAGRYTVGTTVAPPQLIREPATI